MSMKPPARRVSRVLGKVVLQALLVLVALFFLGPLVWFFLLAIRPSATNFAKPPVLMFQPTARHFEYTFLNPGVSQSNLWASIIEAGGATLVALPLALLAAYGFSRFRFPGRRFLELWYLGLLLAPPIIFVIPYYTVLAQMGWLGTYQGIILVFQSFAIPLGVWLLRSFIDEIPVELEEAAQVDGTTRLGALIRVTLPLASPAIVVAGTFIFVFCWNNLLFPLVLSSGPTEPLPVGTLSFFATAGVGWNNIAATAVLTMLVPMIIFWSLRRHIIRGLMIGGVKG